MIKVYICKMNTDIKMADKFKFSEYHDLLIRDTFGEKRINEINTAEKLLIFSLNDTKIIHDMPLRIIRNEYGKPSLLDSKVKYNITHSNDLIAVAISDKEVGIDIEMINEKHQKIAEKVLSSEEMQQFTETGRNMEILIKSWVIKESYLKYLGTGLNQGLNTLLPELIYDQDLSSVYRINDVDVTVYRLDNYYLAIAGNDINKDIIIKNIGGLYGKKLQKI